MSPIEGAAAASRGGAGAGQPVRGRRASNTAGSFAAGGFTRGGFGAAGVVVGCLVDGGFSRAHSVGAGRVGHGAEGGGESNWFPSTGSRSSVPAVGKAAEHGGSGVPPCFSAGTAYVHGIGGVAVARRYSAAADDSATQQERREAAMFVCAAQGHVDDEDAQKALPLARNALDIFRRLADSEAVADTQHLIIDALLIDAQFLLMFRDEPDQLAESSLQEAEDIALQEFATFLEAGDRRGEAVMLLCLAKVLCFRIKELGAHDRQEEALSAAESAGCAAAEVGDLQLQAGAAFERAVLLCLRQEVSGAISAAGDAVQFCQEVGCRVSEAKAWHQLGMARELAGAFPEAIQAMLQARSIYGELGQKRLEAGELVAISEHHIMNGRAAAALGSAQEAAVLVEELGDVYDPTMRGALLVVANTVLILALGLLGRSEEARALIEAEVLRCQKIGSRRLTFLARMARHTCQANDGTASMEDLDDSLSLYNDWVTRATLFELKARVHVRQEEYDLAVQCLLDAQAAVQEGGDKSRLAELSGQLADLHVDADDTTYALWSAQEQRDMYKETGERGKEAHAMLKVASLAACHGNLKLSRRMANEACEIFRSTGDSASEAWALLGLAEIHVRVCGELGDVEQLIEQGEALGVLYEAARLFGAAGQRRYRGRALRYVARLEVQFQRPEQVMIAAEEALGIANKCGDRVSEVDCMIYIAWARVEWAVRSQHGLPRGKALLRAIKAAQEAVNLAKQVEEPYAMPTASLALAYVLLVARRPESALEAARVSLRVFRDLGDEHGEAEALMSMSEAKFLLGKLLESVGFAQQAKKLSPEDRTIAARADTILRQPSGLQSTGAPRPQDQGTYGRLAAMAMGEEVAPASAAVSRGPDPAAVMEKVVEVMRDHVPVDEGAYPQDDPLMDLGMDSLSAIVIRNSLNRSLRVSLPASVTFDYPTVRQLAEHIVESLDE